MSTQDQLIPEPLLLEDGPRGCKLVVSSCPDRYPGKDLIHHLAENREETVHRRQQEGHSELKGL